MVQFCQTDRTEKYRLYVHVESSRSTLNPNLFTSLPARVFLLLPTNIKTHTSTYQMAENKDAEAYQEELLDYEEEEEAVQDVDGLKSVGDAVKKWDSANFATSKYNVSR